MYQRYSKLSVSKIFSKDIGRLRIYDRTLIHLSAFVNRLCNLTIKSAWEISPLKLTHFPIQSAISYNKIEVIMRKPQ